MRPSSVLRFLITVILILGAKPSLQTPHPPHPFENPESFDYELRLFAQFVELINDTLQADRKNVNGRVLVDRSDQLPNVVMSSAMQYLMATDKEGNQNDRTTQEIMPTSLFECSKSRLCTFRIHLKNDGPAPIHIEQLRLTAFTGISLDGDYYEDLEELEFAQELLLQQHQQQALIRITKLNQIIFEGNTTINSSDDYSRYDSDDIHIRENQRKGCQPTKSEHISHRSPRTLVLDPQQTLIIEVLLSGPIPRHLKFRQEALVRLVFTSATAATNRKRRQTPANGQLQTFRRTNILPNGCIMSTHTWDFNDHRLNAKFALKDIFRLTGLPVGVYEISYCTTSSTSSCREPRNIMTQTGSDQDRNAPQRSPHLPPSRDNPSAVYYLQNLIYAELRQKGLVTGCCFPIQYRDIQLQFANGHSELIADASAQTCACFHGIDIPKR